MSDTYQIVFLRAGDGSQPAKRTVAENIARATKSAPEQLLKQIEKAPFIYKKGLPRAKADNIAAALTKLGAICEVRAEPGAAAAPPRPPAPAPGGVPPSGFDFGGPADAPAGGSGAIPGYSFDAPPAGAPPASGFEFGAPAAARGDEFPVEEPSGQFGTVKPGGAPAAPAFGGFNFSPEAAITAPAQKAPVSEVAVSRNLDYAEEASRARSDAPRPAAPAKARSKEARTVTCPRCHAEVPEADECASCGVVMAKAGEPAGAQSAPARRRPVAASKPAKSPLLYAGIGVLAVAALGAAAFFGGLLNPWRLKLDVGGSALLQAYGITVPPPSGAVAEAVVASARSGDVEQFIARSQAIDQELNRMAGLASLADFDQASRALETETGEYLNHPVKLVFAETQRVVGPYYPIRGVAIGLAGALYMFPEEIELTGQKDNPKVVALLSDSVIRERLKAARVRVEAAEALRLAAERAAATDVSWADNFDAGIGERWQKSQSSAVQATGGRLRLIAQPAALAQSPRLVAPEPAVDYVARVNVSGGGEGSRGGIVALGASGGFLAAVKGRRGGADSVDVVSERGELGSVPAGRDAQIRIEKKGGEYVFSAWNGQRGAWVEVARQSPSWAREPGRTVGLVATGRGASFEFDDWDLTVGP